MPRRAKRSPNNRRDSPPRRPEADSTTSAAASQSIHYSALEFEDGTNVLKGTDFAVRMSVSNHWYSPNDSQAVDGWKDRWSRLKERFERIVDEHRPVEVQLLEQRIPACGGDSANGPPREHHRERIQFGSGLNCDLYQLVAPAGFPIFSDYPILDAAGAPMCNSAGSAFGFRFGLSRQLRLYSGPNYVRETRTLPGPRLMELASDAASLLFGLPRSLAVSLWKNWRYGFERERRSEGYLWLDALFELSWQSPPGSTLHSTRYAWRDNTSIALTGDGLFPRLPDMRMFPFQEEIPHEYGYPLAWYSTIKDLARASVAGIDEILERAHCVAEAKLNANRVSEAKADKQHQVFISYSHKDQKFLTDLLTHLKPYVRSGSVTHWSDKRIAPGSEWPAEIQQALRQAKVAVLLVSPNFLASDFIHEHELSPLLTEAQAGGLRILWVRLRACAYDETPLKNYQAVVSPPQRPLAEMKAERDQAWVQVCEAIKDAVN